MKQDVKEGNTAYSKRFRSARDIVESQYGRLVPNEYVETLKDKSELKLGRDMNEQELTALWKDAEERFWAIAYMKGANHHKSNELMKDMSNDYAMGVDKYPKTLNEAVEVMNNYKAQAYTKNPDALNAGVEDEDSDNDSASDEDSRSGNDDKTTGVIDLPETPSKHEENAEQIGGEPVPKSGTNLVNI